MNYLFKTRVLLQIITLFILIFLLIPSSYSLASENIWNENWSYHQEIIIPFATNTNITHFQPVDIKIEFKNPCWGKNEKENSIRIVCWDGKEWHELESQIYNLEIKNNIINSCCVVFLIPNYADGSEKYFVYYDDSEKPSTNYFDHVKIEESYYKYEPISGYPLESSYYKIIDDGFITYAISYEGQIMGYNTCQHVTKMKKQTVEVLPKNGELFAAFDFKYSYGGGVFDYSSTSQMLSSKEILIDGNLMLEFRIISTSKLNDLQTIATYKYYHCPSSNTRIHVHVKDKALKEINVYPNPPSTNCDGVFASLQSGGVKSKSIAELNIGKILPFLHFYNEMEKISEYNINTNPEYIPENPDIRIISVFDDVNLGTTPWVSFDEGKSGLSHAIIFSSNNVVTSDGEENKGIQINAFEMDYPHLPGLDNSFATIQLGRNSVKKDKNHNLIIPKEFTVEFDAEFFSSEKDGYSIIKDESEIFKKLTQIEPVYDNESNGKTQEIEKHNLTVIVHQASSIPMGSSLSALLGLNFSYISAELYKNDEFIFSENAVRLPIIALEDIKDLNFVKKIISIIKIFDIKNLSIFKTAVFRNIENGKYVVKIFRENPFISKEKQYIGYSIIDLKKDEKIHIFCNLESSFKVKVIDQNNETIKDAILVLQINNTNISKSLTNELGEAILKAPVNNKLYDFKVFYNNCNIYQEKIKLGLLNKYRTLDKIVNVKLYTLKLKVTDTWNQTPEIELNPLMKIVNNNDSNEIFGEKIDNDTFIFRNLTQNVYQLNLSFKSFIINEKIEINEDKNIEIKFPAEYNLKFNVFNSRGELFENTKLVIRKLDKKIVIDNYNSKDILKVPPGKYIVEIYNNDELIGRRNIDLLGEQKFDLITKSEPIYPLVLILICILFLVILFIITFYRKKTDVFYKTLLISILIISLFLPWWGINGTSGKIETSTNLYLIPNNMITMTTSDNAIAGEPSYLPPEFKNSIIVIFIFTIVGSILLFINKIYRDKKRIKQLSLIFSMICFTGSLILFTIAINELSRVSIGSIIGSDFLDVTIPGENQTNSILSNWGFGIGFYLYFASVLVFTITIFIKCLKHIRKKK